MDNHLPVPYNDPEGNAEQAALRQIFQGVITFLQLRQLNVPPRFDVNVHVEGYDEPLLGLMFDLDKTGPDAADRAIADAENAEIASLFGEPGEDPQAISGEEFLNALFGVPEDMDDREAYERGMDFIRKVKDGEFEGNDQKQPGIDPRKPRLDPGSATPAERVEYDPTTAAYSDIVYNFTEHLVARIQAALNLVAQAQSYNTAVRTTIQRMPEFDGVYLDANENVRLAIEQALHHLGAALGRSQDAHTAVQVTEDFNL